MARGGARRGRCLGVVVLLVAGLAAGCSHDDRRDRRAAEPPLGSGPLPVGTSTRTVAMHGLERTVRVHRPERLPDPAALVVVLHGGFGSAAQAEGAYGWDALADQEGFVVAYPEGVARAWDAGGGCCGPPGRRGIDDVAFVMAAVDSIGAAIPIDATRTFVTGISNGGMLAYRLACDTTTFAAIGPVAATQLGSCDAPGPVSVIHVHGSADPRIPMDGSQGTGIAQIDGPPIADLIASWRTVDRCAPAAGTTTGVVTTELATCPAGRAVELVTVAGGGHQWPKGHTLDATQVIWAFFVAHPRTDD
jgi:polyhydroxybutyrate depolymerase